MSNYAKVGWLNVIDNKPVYNKKYVIKFRRNGETVATCLLTPENKKKIQMTQKEELTTVDGVQKKVTFSFRVMCFIIKRSNMYRRTLKDRKTSLELMATYGLLIGGFSVLLWLEYKIIELVLPFDVSRYLILIVVLSLPILVLVCQLKKKVSSNK